MSERRSDNSLRSAVDRLRSETENARTPIELLHSAHRQLCGVLDNELETDLCAMIALEIKGRNKGSVTAAACAQKDDSGFWMDIPFTGEGLLSQEDLSSLTEAGGAQFLRLSATMRSTESALRGGQRIGLLPLFEGGNLLALFLVGMPLNADENDLNPLYKRIRPWLAVCASGLRMLQSSAAINRAMELGKKAGSELQNELDQMFFNSLEAILCADEAGYLISANGVALSLFAIQQEKLNDWRLADFVPERFPSELRTRAKVTAVKTIIGQPPLMRDKVMLRRADGSEFIGNISLYEVLRNGQSVTTVHVQDLQSFEEVERRADSAISRFKAVADLAPTGIIQVDEAWEAVYSNTRWSEITGLSRDDSAGLGWINAIHPEDVESTLKQLRVSMMSSAEFEREFRVDRIFNEVRWVRCNAQPVSMGWEAQGGFIATFTDITEQREAEEQLRTLAETDALTGLVNRTVIQDRIAYFKYNDNAELPVTVMYLDLDGFKSVNDTYGHAAGDEVLRETADRLREILGSNATIGRMGGDEFVVVLQGIRSAFIVEQYADRVRERISDPIFLGQFELLVNCSIGIAMMSHENDRKHDMLKRADAALYRAKASGRNCVEFYNAAISDSKRMSDELASELPKAMQQEQFYVEYQPQWDIASGELVGLEALLRWRHPARGVIYPDDFIHLLEDGGLISKMGLWVASEAAMQMRKWIDQQLVGDNVVMSINISPRQLHNRNFASELSSILERCEVPAKRLLLEITESVFFDESMSSAHTLQRLSELEFSVALDDFGTGYSSLSYLKRIPLSVIKVDKSFVTELAVSDEDRAITGAVIALAKSLKMTVVAEGVSDAQSLAFLAELGCDHAQGFYLCEPMTASELEARLKHGDMIAEQMHSAQNAHGVDLPRPRSSQYLVRD